MADRLVSQLSRPNQAVEQRRPETPLLDVNGLTVHFRPGGRRIDALKDFDLSLGEGEFVSLVGPSGCGKSTLLRVVAGLHKDFSGTVAIDPAIRRNSLGFVFQRDSLLPWRTVLDNVAMGLGIRGVGKKERRERARALLDRVVRRRPLVSLERHLGLRHARARSGLCKMMRTRRKVRKDARPAARYR